MSSTINSIKVQDPVYYHREYKNDVSKEPNKACESTWINTCQRVGFAALPFFSLYKPLSLPLSLAMGGLRTYTSITQLFGIIKSGDTKNIPFEMMQASISVIALAGTIFAHPLGMLISTGNDLVIEVCHLVHNLRAGNCKKAAENCLEIINNALYLALFLHGGLELSIASLAMQILIGLYHSQAEFRNGHYIEGVGHLLMSMVRGNQLAGQTKMLQTKWLIENSLKKAKERQDQNSPACFKETQAKKPTQLNSKKMIFNKLSTSNIGIQNIEYIELAEKARSGNNQELIDILIKYGNNPDQIPVLHYAIKCRDFNAVRILVENGSNVNLKINGTSPIHYAIDGKDLEIMRYLYTKGATLDDKCIRKAALSNFIEGFDFLIINKAPIPTDADLLHDLLKKNISREIIIKLINCGSKCDVYFENRTYHGNLENVGLITLAVVRKDFELVQILIAKGAPVNDGTRSPYERPLWQAISSGQKEIAQYLLLHGAAVSHQALDNWIWNLRYYMTLNEIQKIGYMKQIELAIDLKVFDQNRIQQLFEIALEFNELSFVKKIFENGAKIQDKYLSDAAKKGYKELMEWLLENGAKP